MRQPGSRPACGRWQWAGRRGLELASQDRGRARGGDDDRWRNDEGPHSRFLIAIVKCVATKYPLHARRLYLGGISSGATMTNRALTFRSDFWAGGLRVSGEWYVTSDDGTGLTFDVGRAAVQANPAEIFQGRVGPLPLRAELNPMIVITVWGGPNDLWRCSGVLCADYRPSTQAAFNYFSSIPCGPRLLHQQPRPYVDTDQYSGVQPVGRHNAGRTSEGNAGVRFPPVRAA